METEPVESSVESMETSWVKYGRMIVLLELLETVRADWTGVGVQLWIQRELEKLQDEL